MSIVRFVHAADLHLDSPFRGLLTLEPHVAKALQRATFAAYDRIIDLCLKEGVDALLVAGDVFDGADRSLRAQLHFVDGLRRLEDGGIRSFICHGNHDPLDGWGAKLSFPPGCYRFGPEVERVPVFPDDPDRAMVHGISYPTREVRENLIPRFEASGSARFSIGLVHANVGADTGHEPYAPCTLEDLEASGIDYWALGHVHTRKVLRERSPTVVYPGNPQGRHPNERGGRGVYLVDVSDSGEVDLAFQPVDVARWEHTEVRIDGMEDEQALIDAVDQRVEEACAAADGRDLVFRLWLAGRGVLHKSIGRPDFTDDVRARLNETWAQRTPFAFCERITDDTAPPFDRQERSRAEDFIGDLLRLVDGFKEDPKELEALVSELDTLYRAPRAGRILRDELPPGDGLLQLLEAAEALCVDRLLDGDRRED